MELAEFYKRVGARSESIDGEAPEIVHAVLAALAPRLPRGSAEDLAADLPRPLRKLLGRADGSRDFERDDYLEDVAGRLDCDDEEAEQAVLAVLGTLRELLESYGPVDQVVESLPSDLALLMHDS